MRPFLKHTNWLEDAFRQIDDAGAFTFGAACVERQWPVYERAAAGEAWGRQPVLRAALDSIWDWLLGVGGRPSGLWQQCEAAVLEEFEGDAAAAATEVAGSFLSLTHGIERGEPRGSLQATVNGLNIIEAYVYEHLGLSYSPENNLRVDQHELIQSEIKRQVDDLTLLLKARPSVVTINRLREKSRGVSILGNYWF